VNADVEQDALLRLVAALPQTQSDTARAERVRARCRKVIARRTERSHRAHQRTLAHDRTVTRALYRIWYSFLSSPPSRL
jgi:hypothetical protein